MFFAYIININIILKEYFVIKYIHISCYVFFVLFFVFFVRIFYDKFINLDTESHNLLIIKVKKKKEQR